MVQLITIRSNINKGEQMLKMLRAGKLTDHTLELYCKDSVVKLAHMNVLDVCSKYFSDIMKEKPDLRKMQVAYHSNVIDKVLDCVYTNERISVPKDTVVQLFSAARLFQIKELGDQLKSFLVQQMAQLLKNQDFLLSESVEDVYRLKEIFQDPLLNCDKFSLLTRLEQWGKRNGGPNRLMLELIDVCMKPMQDKLIADLKPSQTAVMLMNKDHFYGIFPGKLISSKAPTRLLASQIDQISTIVMRSSYVYVTKLEKHSAVELYDLQMGVLVRETSLPRNTNFLFDLVPLTMLSLFNKRVYAYHYRQNKLYEIMEPSSCNENAQLVLEIEHSICSLTVLEHDEFHIKCLYLRWPSKELFEAESFFETNQLLIKQLVIRKKSKVNIESELDKENEDTSTAGPSSGKQSMKTAIETALHTTERPKLDEEMKFHEIIGYEDGNTFLLNEKKLQIERIFKNEIVSSNELKPGFIRLAQSRRTVFALYLNHVDIVNTETNTTHSVPFDLNNGEHILVRRELN